MGLDDYIRGCSLCCCWNVLLYWEEFKYLNDFKSGSQLWIHWLQLWIVLLLTVIIMWDWVIFNDLVSKYKWKESLSVCLSVCPSIISTNYIHNNFSDLHLAGVLRTKGSAVWSVKLFGWAVLGKAASSNTRDRAIGPGTGIYNNVCWYRRKNRTANLHILFCTFYSNLEMQKKCSWKHLPVQISAIVVKQQCCSVI